MPKFTVKRPVVKLAVSRADLFTSIPRAMSFVPPSASDADYAWQIATLFPAQGTWSEEAYLDLTDGTNRRIELALGRLEFLPMPTERHQALAGFLYHALLLFVSKHDLGLVPFPPLRVRTARGGYREPDVLFLSKANFHLRSNRIWKGADLVIEVVSGDPKDRQRDYEDKLRDYAETGIAEYWIVDHERRVVTVHQLGGERYELYGEFRPGQQAASLLVAGFAVNVAELFTAADRIAE